MTDTTPVQTQLQTAVCGTAGTPRTATDVEPGAHTPVVAGTQGAGVNTPDAAVVAAWTAGFDGLIHWPNVAILVIGAVSETVASDTPGACAAAGFGKTTNADGAVPMEHLIVAP